jgi:hypothetical protein
MGACESDYQHRFAGADIRRAMQKIRRNGNGIAWTHLNVLAAGTGMQDPALDHDQHFTAIRVAVLGIGLAWLQNATADGDILGIADLSIGEPGELTPFLIDDLAFFGAKNSWLIHDVVLLRVGFYICLAKKE